MTIIQKSTITLCTLAATILLFGCNGPTKTGIEMREKASARVNAFGAQVHFEQARKAFRTGQFEQAMHEINTAIERYPEGGQYYVLQGRIYGETHRLEKAVESFEKALDLDEELTEAHYHLGIVYQRWSDDEQAVEHYLAAFEAQPSNAAYMIAAAETLIAMQEYESAEALLKPKLAYFEHNTALYELLAQIAMLENEYEEAADLYREAVSLDESNPIILRELARAQFAAERYRPCLKTIETLYERDNLDEAREEWLRTEAMCLQSIGQTKRAYKRYQQLTKLTPSEPEAWVELAAIAHDMGDFRRLGMASVRIIALAPKRHEGYLFKGLTERNAGRISEAISLFQRSAELAPDDALPHLLLGLTLQQQGDEPAAYRAFADGLEAEPDNEQARVLMDNIELE